MFNKKQTDYLLVFALIANSGFVFFYLNEVWILIASLFTYIIAKKRGVFSRIDKEFITIISIFVFWELIQFFVFGGFRLQSLLGTFLRLYLAYFVIKSVNFAFIKIYLDLIYFFTIVSLVFYSLYFIAPSFINNLVAIGEEYFNYVKYIEGSNNYGRPNLIIFNFHGFELTPFRNSGPFWEPGAFAVYLSLALILSFLIDDTIITKKNCVFIIGLMTTISTTGVLLLFLILFYIINLRYRKSSLLYLFIPFILFYFYQFFLNSDFLAAKINDNVNLANETTTSRFGSALADMYLFVQNPVLGYGRNLTAQYGSEKFNLEQMHRNNGLTRVFVQWGLLALVYLYNIKKSFSNICKQYPNNLKITSFTIFFVILFNGFSQNIFQYTFFYGLMFLQFIDQRYYKHQNYLVK